MKHKTFSFSCLKKKFYSLSPSPLPPSLSLSLSHPLSLSPMVSEIRLNKLHASAMAAKSLISYTCLITVVGSHFLFDMQPSRVKQASVNSEH